MAAAPENHAADRAALEVRHKGLLTLVVMAGVLMQVLDSTIANVALPHMQAALGATPESITWTLTSYIVASAMITPIAGWLSDRFGVRGLFLLSVTWFVIASALCGVAANLSQMVAFRVLQGIGGAPLSPLGQSVILNINRPSEHPRAMAVYGTGSMVGPVLGPIIGGWLTDNYDWRWVFFINVPLGIACFAGLWWLMPRVRRVDRPFDVFGWALIATALASFQLLLDRGGHVDWFDATECWIEAGVAAGALWMFVVHTATARRPLFPAAMLGDANLIIGCLFMTSLALVQLSGLALLPSMLQGLFGYSVLTTGTILATRGVGLTVAMWLASRLLPLLGPRVVMGGGLVLLTYSMWMMTQWSLDMDARPVVVSGLVQGVAMGLVFLPMNVVTFATLPSRFRTDGAAMMNLSRNTGGSIGIALASTMLAHNLQVSHADLAEHLTPYNLPVDPTLLGTYGELGEGVLRMVDGLVQRQATMIALLDDFHMFFLVSIFALPLAFFVRPQRRHGPGGRNADEPLHVGME